MLNWNYDISAQINFLPKEQEETHHEVLHNLQTDGWRHVEHKKYELLHFL